MKEKTLLLLWLAPVFFLLVHTFEGRVDLTWIKNVQNNLVDWWGTRLALCGAVLEGPESTFHACANWLSLVRSQLETAPVLMPDQLSCAVAGSLSGFIPSCGSTVPHGGKTSCILVVPLDWGSLIMLIQIYGEILCGHHLWWLLPSPRGALLAFENHLASHGVVGQSTDLVVSSRMLPEDTNQLLGPHILWRHIKGQIFWVFAGLWIWGGKRIKTVKLWLDLWSYG